MGEKFLLFPSTMIEVGHKLSCQFLKSTFKDALPYLVSLYISGAVGLLMGGGGSKRLITNGYYMSPCQFKQ